MRIDQLPTFSQFLSIIKELEVEEVFLFDTYHGWNIGLRKLDEWEGSDDSHPKTISVIISGEKVESSWIENHRKDLLELFDKYLIPLERKDKKWYKTSSREEIMEFLKNKWTDWFEYKDEDIEVEWEDEERLAKLLLEFLRGLKDLYRD